MPTESVRELLVKRILGVFTSQMAVRATMADARLWLRDHPNDSGILAAMESLIILDTAFDEIKAGRGNLPMGQKGREHE